MLLNPKFRNFIQTKLYLTDDQLQEIQRMHFDSMFTLFVDECIAYLEEKDMQTELKHLDSMAASKASGKIFMKNYQEILKFFFKLANNNKKLAKRISKRIGEFEREAFYEVFATMPEKTQLEIMEMFQKDLNDINKTLSDFKATAFQEA